MPIAGFSRKAVGTIAAAIRLWPGGWTLDLVSDAGACAVVLLPEDGDQFGPALHLGQDATAVIVTAVRWDRHATVGVFEDLAAALDHLGRSLSAESGQHGPATLH